MDFQFYMEDYLRLEFGFASSYIISLQQVQSCPDYIYDYIKIGPTPWEVLARLKLEFGFASFIWRTI